MKYLRISNPKIIIVDKPAGRSSAFISRLVGKMLGVKKVGHIGTLDPFATGVLPIVFNEATRIIPYIKCEKKKYIFTMEFGAKTNTGDCTGNIIEQTLYIPTLEQINSVLSNFIGTVKQKPHAFSAVKINGTRAYKLSKSGHIPDIKARDVTIFDIHVIEQCNERVFKLEATVSPGTYIRTLCEDIAVQSDSLAFVKELRRIVDGKFFIEDAVQVDDIAKRCYTSYDPEDVLDDIPVVLIGLHEKERLLNGLCVELCAPSGVVLTKCNGFLAIADSTGASLSVKRVIRHY